MMTNFYLPGSGNLLKLIEAAESIVATLPDDQEEIKNDSESLFQETSAHQEMKIQIILKLLTS